MTEGVPPAVQAKLDDQLDTILSLTRIVGSLEHQIGDLRERLGVAESLVQRQSGILISLYNGVNQLSSLMLLVNQTSSDAITSALTRRERPLEAMERVEKEIAAFDLALKDIYERLEPLDEHKPEAT